MHRISCKSQVSTSPSREYKNYSGQVFTKSNLPGKRLIIVIVVLNDYRVSFGYDSIIIHTHIYKSLLLEYKFWSKFLVCHRLNFSHLNCVKSSSESIAGNDKVEHFSYIGWGVCYPPLKGHRVLKFYSSFIQVLLSQSFTNVKLHILSWTHTHKCCHK